MPARRIVIVACGTSYHAGLLGRANHCVIFTTDALHMLERLSPWEYHVVRRALEYVEAHPDLRAGAGQAES